ncbi:EI24 domain-containing protein [Winogradskyella immobilis]|uniref:EI24 domain-containing protein n=1 Tax=Winogradskyella immobilis TaxID=2816852 RepID=A0ABS8EPP2_9FLAO|nr:EI24 domain-containing protein [Winogradskyella immobilis]MCC1485191.1 EI24 domain-containing protein [Winogradskyella immobilis]MCG0017283.1 EI24 domain-containing protein [Winogradskyella immobilis]
MIQNIIRGLQVYTGAYGLISKLKLWKYFVIPMIISFVVSILILIAAYSLSDNLGEWIASVWVWEFGKETFTFISTIIAAIIIFFIGAFLFKHIIMALSSPFMSPVSEKIESFYTGQPAKNYIKTSFTKQLLRGIRISLRNLSQELLFTIPILLLKFIPVVNIFSTALLFIMQAYYAGFGNMDYTLERHFTYKESVAFIRKNRGLAIGNGIGFLLLLFIPVIGVILVLPLSVTSASVIAVDLLYEPDDDYIGFEPFEKLKA